jgi:hypothetical protein
VTARDELARDIFLADNSSFPAGVAEKDWDENREHHDYAYALADRLIPKGYRKPLYLSPGKYRNERGVTLEVESLRMDRNLLGAVWNAKILDDVFCARYIGVTPEGLMDAGYVRIEDAA